jgi:hypothetical protein
VVAEDGGGGVEVNAVGGGEIAQRQLGASVDKGHHAAEQQPAVIHAPAW